MPINASDYGLIDYPIAPYMRLIFNETPNMWPSTCFSVPNIMLDITIAETKCVSRYYALLDIDYKELPRNTMFDWEDVFDEIKEVLTRELFEHPFMAITRSTLHTPIMPELVPSTVAPHDPDRVPNAPYPGVFAIPTIDDKQPQNQTLPFLIIQPPAGSDLPSKHYILYGMLGRARSMGKREGVFPGPEGLSLVDVLRDDPTISEEFFWSFLCWSCMKNHGDVEPHDKGTVITLYQYGKVLNYTVR